MGKNLKSENLAICVPYNICNKKCAYCVSNMTWNPPVNQGKMYVNARKVKWIAERAEITSLLFTGKGEPILPSSTFDFLEVMATEFKDFPKEIQTNGISLSKDLVIVDFLRRIGIDIVAISIDDEKDFALHTSTIDKINSSDMITRLTICLNNNLGIFQTFHLLINYCIDTGVRQLTLRRLISPINSLSDSISKWINDNTMSDEEYNIFSSDILTRMHKDGKLFRTTNDGVTFWDYKGVSIALYDQCIQEQSFGDNVRSLIFHQDGHLYTSWNSPASILF